MSSGFKQCLGCLSGFPSIKTNIDNAKSRRRVTDNNNPHTTISILPLAHLVGGNKFQFDI